MRTHVREVGETHVPTVRRLQPIETFWGVAKNHAASLYKSGRKMRAVVAQLRAAWYGAPATDTEGVGANRREPKEAVNCAGLIDKSVAEAQKMVDGFKGVGVWGSLAGDLPSDEQPAVLTFGYSGQLASDDANGWDDGVAERLKSTECEHIQNVLPDVAQRHNMVPGEQPAPPQQHRRAAITAETADAAAAPRPLRWVNPDALAEADIESPKDKLIDTEDHQSAAEITEEPAVEGADGPELTDTVPVSELSE